MRFSDVVLLVSALVLIVFTLIYIYLRRNVFSLRSVLHEATLNSEFNPTVFEIYDRSSALICDRLIVVKPFDWLIWAFRGELIVFVPESSQNCSVGQSAAIHIHKTSFHESCLSLDYDALLQSYMKEEKHSIPYSIESKQFTIFSAINILLDGYITFNDDLHLLSEHHIHSINNSKTLEPRLVVQHFKEAKELTPQRVVQQLLVHLNKKNESP